MNERFSPPALAPRPELPGVPAPYAALIANEARVSPQLRAELEKRAKPDDPSYRARSMSEAQLVTLRAALARIVPQDGPDPIDLAARIDTMMANATGNGWRFEALPSDSDAYRIGLDTLDDLARARRGCSFAELAGRDADALFVAMEKGEAGIDAPERFDPERMTLWFEELRSDAVRQYVAHPAILARIGYSGIANGGPGGAAFAGFERIGIGEREPFEVEGTQGAAR